MAVPLAVAGGAAAISALPFLVGRGKNDRQAEDFSTHANFDSFANQFGNFGAENYKEGREQQARQIDNRSAFQANYMQANQDRQRGLQARAGQAQVQNMMLARAMGKTPSIADMQGQQMMQKAAAQQASVGASARGAAGLALANQNTANQTANLQSNIAGQTAVAAANERLQAEQAAFGAASGMRQGDLASQNQSADQAQFQAGLQVANRNANDARAMGYAQMGHQALGQEQQGRVQMQGILAQSHASAEQANQRSADQNAQNKGLIETVGDFLSDMRAKESVHFPSDFSAKGALQGSPLPSQIGGGGFTTSTIGGGGTNPMSGPGEASFDVLNGDGSMDPMGSLKKHSDFATQFQRDPTSGMSGGGLGGMSVGDGGAASGIASFFSDDQTKLRAAFDAGQRAAVQGAAQGAVAPPPAAKPESTKEQPKDDKKPVTKAQVAREVSEQLQEASTNILMGPAGMAQKMMNEGGWAAKREMHNPRPGDAEAFKRALVATGRAAIGPVGSHFVDRAPQSIPSDFTAKQSLAPKQGLTRDMFGNPGAGDPNAPRMVFDAQRGWSNPQAQGPSLQEALAAQNAEDRRDPIDIAGQDAAVADLRVKDDQRAELASMPDKPEDPGASWTDQRTWKSKGKKSDAKKEEMAPGTDDWEKTQPKAGDEDDKPAWWESLPSIVGGLNAAQFGDRDRYYHSDERAKHLLEDPKFDWDAEDRRAAADPRRQSAERNFHRDTPQDQARVKRAVEDKASRDADEMMAGYQASLGKGSALASRLGPSDSDVARANRTMKGVPYVYKKEYTPKDQRPGEVNYGFMAQNLEKEPVTATAVKEDPSVRSPNGDPIKTVDALKLLRVLGASVADLQQQEDESRVALKGLARVVAKKGGARG